MTNGGFNGVRMAQNHFRRPAFYVSRLKLFNIFSLSGFFKSLSPQDIENFHPGIFDDLTWHFSLISLLLILLNTIGFIRRILLKTFPNFASSYFIALNAEHGVVGIAFLSSLSVNIDSGNIKGILGIALSPGVRGIGLSNALIGAIIGEAMDMELAEIVLTVMNGNLPARKLYQKWGFVEVSEEIDYWRGMKLPSTRMILNLKDSTLRQHISELKKKAIERIPSIRITEEQ